MSQPLKVTRRVLQTIEQDGKRSYPYECCGVLVGSMSLIVEAYPVNNIEVERRNDRFVLDPRGYLEVEEKAISSGLKIVGFYHTHPDHPAYPSQTDLAWAWEGYWYIIQKVEKGEPGELNFFTLKGRQFEKVEIQIE